MHPGHRRAQAEPLLVRVVGRHCESGDIVVDDEYLPADVRRRVTSWRCRGPAPTADRLPATTTTSPARRSWRCVEGVTPVLVRT